MFHPLHLILHSYPLLPPRAAHFLFNNFVGIITRHTDQPYPLSAEIVQSVLTLLTLVTDSQLFLVAALYYIAHMYMYMDMCVLVYVQYRSDTRYKARVCRRRQTHLYTELNTCLYMAKWVYTRRQTRLHTRRQTHLPYTLHLICTVHTCTCTYVYTYVCRDCLYSLATSRHVHVCLEDPMRTFL